MAVEDLLNWTRWTVLPQTTMTNGLEEFRGLQFEYPRRDIDFSAWKNSLSFTVSGTTNIDRKLGINGFLVADSADEWGVFKSGPKLTWDFIIHNIPIVTSANGHIPLYAVRYPDSRADDNDVPDVLEVRAGRSAVYNNRVIGTSHKAGNYVNIGFSVWRIRNTNGNVFETRISSTVLNTTVLEDDAVDVEDVETRLEFFYIDFELKSEIFMTIMNLPPEEYEKIHFGDFLLGISSSAQVSGEGKYTSYILWMPTQETFETYIQGLPMGYERDPIFGEGASKGGYDDDPGTYDKHSDNITLSNLPTVSALTAGFVNAYRVSTSDLRGLGSALFPPPVTGLTPANVVDAIVDFYNLLSSMWWNSKTSGYVLDCHIIPVNVPAGANANITAGGRELRDADFNPIDAPVVSSMYVRKSCGALTIPEYFGNFLDYTVKCKLYLPCYGYVDIPAEYWNGGTISVEYIFNVFDGSFVAVVTAKAKHSNLNSVIGQYAGMACTHIPITGQDYSTLIAGLMATAIGTTAQAAAVPSTATTYTNTLTTEKVVDTSSVAQKTMGVGANGSQMGQMTNWNNNIDKTVEKKQDSTNFATGGKSPCTALSGLGAVMGMKPGMINNGSTNSSASMMMHKKPYLIIEYPTPQFSTGYPKERGLPLNVSAPLGKFGGMTIAENPILDGITCTATEKEKIRTALLSGLIFR